MTSGNREHLKVSRAMNLQPYQACRTIGLDLGSSGVDDGTGRNLCVAGRNLLTVNFKTGAGDDAITSTINQFDYQARIDGLFASAGSSSAADDDCAIQSLANKVPPQCLVPWASPRAAERLAIESPRRQLVHGSAPGAHARGADGHAAADAAAGARADGGALPHSGGAHGTHLSSAAHGKARLLLSYELRKVGQGKAR